MDIRTGTDGQIPGNGVVERRIATKDGEIALPVKEALPGRVLIAAGAYGEVKKGAVLLFNKENGIYFTYNDGLHSAIRAVAKHVPNGYDDEQGEIKAWLGTLGWAYSVFVDPMRLPLDEQTMVRRKLEGLYAKHPHFRNEAKVYARDQTGRAAAPKDSLKRVNPMSRLPIIWSADHRLDRRKREILKIGGLIDARARVLLSIRDQLDTVRRNLHHVCDAFLRWRTEPAKMPQKSLGYYTSQFEEQIGVLTAISIAPDGRRSFVHDVVDLRQAVEAIKSGRLEEAFTPVDKVRRSLEILAIREILEEVVTSASVAKERNEPLSDLDRRGAIATAGDIAFRLGSKELFDEDFERPVVAHMRNQFMVLQGHLAQPGLDAKTIYETTKRIVAAA